MGNARFSDDQKSIKFEKFESLLKHLRHRAKEGILERMEGNGGLVLQDLTMLLQADLIDADAHVSWERMGKRTKKEERQTEKTKKTTHETHKQRNSEWFIGRTKLNLRLMHKSMVLPWCEPWCDTKLRPAMHVLAAWLAFATALGVTPVVLCVVIFGCRSGRPKVAARSSKMAASSQPFRKKPNYTLDLPKWLLARRRIMQRLPWWAECILLLLHALVHGAPIPIRSYRALIRSQPVKHLASVKTADPCLRRNHARQNRCAWRAARPKAREWYRLLRPAVRGGEPRATIRLKGHGSARDSCHDLAAARCPSPKRAVIVVARRVRTKVLCFASVSLDPTCSAFGQAH